MQTFDPKLYPSLHALDLKVKKMLSSPESAKWDNGEKMWRIAKIHPVFWMEEYGYVRPGEVKVGGDDFGSAPVRFTLKPEQLQLADKVCGHLVGEHFTRIQQLVLKHRKAGISTLYAAFDYWFMRFYDNFNLMVIADLASHTDNIVEMIKLFHDRDECGNDSSNKKYWVPKTVSMPKNKKGLKLSNGSMLEQDTGENDNPGTSQTVNLCHMSENAKWRNPEDAETSLMNSMPRMGFACIFKESTAFGMNKFQDDCEKAWSGKSSWEFIFLTWLDMPDCCDEVYVGEEILYSPEEQELLASYPKMRTGHIKFRRRQIELLGSIDKFKQDFPLNPREPFLVSGSNFFNPQAVRDRIDAISFYRDWKLHGLESITHRYPDLMIRYKCHPRGMTAALQTLEDTCVVPKMVKLTDNDGSVSWIVEENGRKQDGCIEMYVEPKPGRKYLITVDPAEGKRSSEYTSDNAVIEVFDAMSMEQVAEWAGCFDEEMTASIAVMLAKIYNEALIAPEMNNACGGTLISEINKTEYTNLFYRETIANQKVKRELGWHTKAGLKKDICAQMRLDFKNQNVLIHSLELLEEMLYFMEKGLKLEAADGKHDDRVMATAINIKIINVTPAIREVVAKKEYLPESMFDSFVPSGIRPSRQEALQRYM